MFCGPELAGTVYVRHAGAWLPVCLRPFRASMGGMVRTVYYAAASLDGFTADEQNSGERFREFIGARSEDAVHRQFLAGFGALAMGAGAYGLCQSAGSDDWEYGTLPAWVFTHHEFPGIAGADITFVRGDVAEFHPDIVDDAGTRDVLILGGGDLAGQFFDAGLVDEVVLTVFPLLLGSGRPVLPVKKAAGPAALMDERSLGNGVVQLRYSFRG